MPPSPLLLALLAGCGADNGQTPNTDDQQQSADNQQNENQNPEEPSTTFEGILDKTEDYNIVIETPGTTGNERIGVRAAAGKVEIGQYNKLGSKRIDALEFDWSELGLEGEAWEYLGATFEFDTTGATPVLTNKPEKSCFAIALADVVQDGENLTLPNGKVLPLTDLNYGRLRANNMLNEGGKFASGWNDHSVKASYFDVDDGQTGGYLVCICEKYDASIICKAAELPQ